MSKSIWYVVTLWGSEKPLHSFSIKSAHIGKVVDAVHDWLRYGRNLYNGVPVVKVTYDRTEEE